MCACATMGNAMGRKKIVLKGQERIEWTRLRRRAANAVQRAVLKGDLTDLKSTYVKCSDCVARATVYNHKDYNKPLEAEPVCGDCNIRRGSNAPLVDPRPDEGSVPRCSQCGSSNVLAKKNDGNPLRFCRRCGHEEPVK